MLGQINSPFQWTIQTAEQACAIINELLWLDGEYDITGGYIDNQPSMHMLNKLKAKPLIARYLNRISSLKRAVLEEQTAQKFCC